MLVHAMFKLPTKFEVSSITRYGDMVAKCKKLGGLGWFGVVWGA